MDIFKKNSYIYLTTILVILVAVIGYFYIAKGQSQNLSRLGKDLEVVGKGIIKGGLTVSLQQSENALIIPKYGGKVGIGLDDPQTRFHVLDGIMFGTSTLQLAADENLLLGQIKGNAEGNFVLLKKGNTEVFKINKDGNIDTSGNVNIIGNINTSGNIDTNKIVVDEVDLNPPASVPSAPGTIVIVAGSTCPTGATLAKRYTSKTCNPNDNSCDSCTVGGDWFGANSTDPSCAYQDTSDYYTNSSNAGNCDLSKVCTATNIEAVLCIY